MITIIRKELQILIKEKGTFFRLILLPVIFIVLFSSIAGGKNGNLTIHYIDKDNSTSSAVFIDTLKNIKGFVASSDSSLSEEEQKQKVKEGKLSSLLIISKGFGDSIQSGSSQAQLDFYTTSVPDQTAGAIKAVLQNVANGYREGKISGALTASGKTKTQINEIMLPPVKINEISDGIPVPSRVTLVVPGFMIMFVFYILLTMIRGFFHEKDSGMLARLRSTPMKPINYLMGMWIASIITSLIQCFLLLAFGYFMYNINLGDISAIVPLVFALSICVTGVGLALSFLVGSESQGIAITQIITICGGLLSGLFMPFDMLPPFAQTIGRFTPQYWAQGAMQDIMVRGVHVGNIWLNLVVLLTFGAVGLTVAMLRFKRFILSALN